MHYHIAYHFVWIPKYRRKILTGDVQAKTKRLIQSCCDDRHGLTVLEMETDRDHIPVFVSAPPRFSPAQIANLLKGYSSRYLREKFPPLKRVCGPDQLYVGTAGSVSAEVIRRYIHCRIARKIKALSRRAAAAFIPIPSKGWEFSSPSLRGPLCRATADAPNGSTALRTETQVSRRTNPHRTWWVAPLTVLSGIPAMMAFIPM